MGIQRIDVFCPKCNVLVEAKVIAEGLGTSQQGAVNPIDDLETEYRGDNFMVALCRRCTSPFLIRESYHEIPGVFETVTGTTVLYPVSAETKVEGLPDSIARSLIQAHRSFSTSSYDACALMCRRALEALCKVLSSKGRNLSERLADLHVNGRIDKRLLDWAHGVRLVGNEAAHDVDTGVSVEDARDILEFTESLLTYVFTLDAKFRAFEARRMNRGIT